MRETLIESWKEIADYLGVSVRTVQTWEKEAGLPVHRRSGGQRARVFAVPSELDAWRRPEVETDPHPSRMPRSRLRTVLLLSGLLLPVFVLILVAPRLRTADFPSDRVPSVVVFAGPVMEVRDSEGYLLWNRKFPGHSGQTVTGNEETRRPTARILDIDGDGRPEVLFSYGLNELEESAIYCFEGNGELRWRFAHNARKTFGEREFHRFAGFFLDLVETGERPLLLVVSYHVRYFPSRLVLLEPREGRIVSEYWHPGAAYSFAYVDLDGDGSPELLFGGVNNPGQGVGRPFLAVLDLPFPDPDPKIIGVFGEPAGQERAYFLFPNHEAAELSHVITQVVRIYPEGSSIIAVVEGTPRGASVEYRFDRSLELQSVDLSDGFISNHLSLTHSGVLDHPIGDCRMDRVLRLRTAPDGNALPAQ